VGLRLSADAERKLGANDHQSSLVDLPLFERDGTPTGLSVFTEAAALDTTFTVSVVVTFAPQAATP
jgi:hypothetical protein